MQSQADLDIRFFKAANDGDLETVKLLLSGDPSANVNCMTNPEYKYTALHAASQSGNTVLIRYLISKGADVTVRDDEGVLAAHYFCAEPLMNTEEHLATLKLLLGPDNVLIDEVAPEGRTTCLHQCTANMIPICVSWLLDAGADATIRDEDEQTPWDALIDLSSNGLSWKSMRWNSPDFQVHRLFLQKEMQSGNIQSTLDRFSYNKFGQLEAYCVQNAISHDIYALLEYLVCLTEHRQACQQVHRELCTTNRTENEKQFREPSCTFGVHDHLQADLQGVASAGYFDVGTYEAFKAYMSTPGHSLPREASAFQGLFPSPATYQHRKATNRSSPSENIAMARTPSSASIQKKTTGRKAGHQVSDYLSIVMPIMSIESMSSLKAARKNIDRDLKYRSTGEQYLQSLYSCLTMDEYCYPSLPGSVLERRNKDQTLYRLSGTEVGYNGGIDEVHPSWQDEWELVVVDQAWVWLTQDVLISTSLSGEHNFDTVTHIDVDWSNYAKIASFLAELTDRNEYDQIFDKFQQYIVWLAEKVSSYIDREDGIEAMTIQAEKGFYHNINDVREELSMIDRILTQQEEVWREFAGKFSSGSWNDLQIERNTHLADTAPINVAQNRGASTEEGNIISALIARPRLRIQKSRRRIAQLDEDAERVERTIATQLDLKQKYASLKEAHATAIMSTAVFGFTIITIIFTPLSFIVALFALPVDRFQQSQIPSRWTNEAGMYTSSYIGTWVATTGVASIAATMLAMWLALEFGLKYRLTIKLWNFVKIPATIIRLQELYREKRWEYKLWRTPYPRMTPDEESKGDAGVS